MRCLDQRNMESEMATGRGFAFYCARIIAARHLSLPAPRRWSRQPRKVTGFFLPSSPCSPWRLPL